MERNTSCAGIVTLLLLAVLLFSQGCYVEVDGKRYGQQDTAYPGAELEKGCVVEIERGKTFYPPEPSTVLLENLGKTERFSRYADFGAELEVGKCYQWKLGFGDLWSGKTTAISSDTVREINRQSGQPIAESDG